eukprot:jgi/Bigna1/87732/estExt_fgenesh1_pg.C_230153
MDDDLLLPEGEITVKNDEAGADYGPEDDADLEMEDEEEEITDTVKEEPLDLDVNPKAKNEAVEEMQGAGGAEVVKPELNFYKPPRAQASKEKGEDEAEAETGERPTVELKALSAPRKNKVYLNKQSPFVVGFDICSESEREKMAKRAARFGGSSYNPITNIEGITLGEYEKRQERMKRFGMTETKERVMEDVHKYETPNEPEIGAPEDYRYDTVHLYGITSTMSTKTIFQYFSGMGATKVEWLNDSACNVVFVDSFSCKRALSCLSMPLESEVARVKESHPEMSTRPDLDMIVWRKGKPIDGHRMLLRVCHKGDVKKPVGERKPSKWYQKQMSRRGRGGGRNRNRNRNRQRMEIQGNRASGRRNNRGTRINPRSISIRKNKDKKKLEKTTKTLHNLRIEVVNEHATETAVKVEDTVKMEVGDAKE